MHPLRSPSHRTTLVAGVGLGLAAGVIGAALASLPTRAPVEEAEDSRTAPGVTGITAAVTAPDPARRTPVVEAVERVAPAVVSITTEVPVDDPFARFMGAPRATTSEGSGVVIESDGLVLTNAHVVARASRIQASFVDGRRYDADVLGVAEELDLAVLRLRDAQGLSAVEIGSSEGLMLGEPVIAIGNPFGLGHTVTTGVISATRRPLETDTRVYQDFLQTDASINPGNSGGPLLDVHGRLVGVNTAIRADAEGIGFAIPVDRAIKVAHDLSRFGVVRSPWLGVDLDDVYVRDLSGADGGRAGLGRTAARVVRAYDTNDAAGASLRPGDVIVAIDDRPVQGRADLNAYLAAFEPGRTVRLQVRRPAAERYRDVEVSLAAQGLPDALVQQSLERVLGVAVSDRSGAVQVDRVLPGGAFERIGGRPGDLLVALNGRALRSVDELEAAVAATKSAHRADALLTIRRGSATGRITLPL